MSIRTRLLVDVDGVLCNFTDAFLFEYEQGGGTIPAGWVCDRWGSILELPDKGAIQKAWAAPSLFIRPDPYTAAISTLQALNERLDVRLATALPVEHHEARMEWLDDHAPFIRPEQVIFCAQKADIRGDYLVEDNVDYLVSWCRANPLGTGFLVRRPYNTQWLADLEQRPMNLAVIDGLEDLAWLK